MLSLIFLTALPPIFHLAAAQMTAPGSISVLPSSPTVPSSSLATPTATDLPGLVSELPSCAIPCFESSAKEIGCGVTDFSCLCRAGNAASLGLDMVGCLGGGLGGDNKNNCSISSLAAVAASICSAVGDNPNQSQLAAATSIVSAALASAAATGTSTGTGATTSETGKPNSAGRVVDQAAAGMLAVVAGYAVLVL
ncbi:hypothetical protein QBC46DRAFT_398236 [Diplogelasinospora grovesii]|uniref:CFEM domain-containing protein n=1 Tax=Diplogelasinospora grovesii TaxID=303347 RepID=A0AAN6RZQ8_9PEZI|nr:hypothetical protein QBC46DRAFT_398236 [Diplogelasinospora grovesii]